MKLLLPSPEQKLIWPEVEEAGIDLWIKRDDLIHPLISGNKWRKLSGILEKAQQLQAIGLATFGGAWSNHLLALAACGKELGFRTRGVVRGDAVRNRLLQTCKELGMELTFMSREDYRRVRRENHSLRMEDDWLWIPEGADCPEGREGMQTLWAELDNRYDYLLDAVGSGCSVRGLKQNNPTSAEIYGFMAVKDTELADTLETEGIRVIRESARRGFGRTDPRLLECCKEFEAITGFPLDPVYTGKMWSRFLEMVATGHFPEGSRVLFVHSGGLSGWWSFA